MKAEDQRQVVELWRAGVPIVEIAERLGVSRETVRRIKSEALSEAIEDRDLVVARAREDELQRLDALMAAHWQQALGHEIEAYDRNGNELGTLYDAAGRELSERMVTNEHAAKVVLKCVVERAKLLGLYAPVKVDARVRNELDARIEALMEELETEGLAVRPN